MVPVSAEDIERFPRRILRVQARADSSGYMPSRILMEFSWAGLVEEEEGLKAGSLPGTGTACLGVAEPNCSGEEGVVRDGELNI